MEIMIVMAKSELGIAVHVAISVLSDPHGPRHPDLATSNIGSDNAAQCPQTCFRRLKSRITTYKWCKCSCMDVPPPCIITSSLALRCPS